VNWKAILFLTHAANAHLDAILAGVWTNPRTNSDAHRNATELERKHFLEEKARPVLDHFKRSIAGLRIPFPYEPAF
jgi:hypothetical protein